jgi:hypothetical protein
MRSRFQGYNALGSDLSPEGKHITNVTKNTEMHVLDNNAVWGVGEWSQMIPGPNDTVKALHGSYGCVTVRVGDSWKNRMLVQRNRKCGYG